MRPIGRLNQLRGDTDATARAAYAAFQNICHSQLFSDFADIFVLALERKCGCAGDHFQS